MKHITQSGRSMVEMLGTLAIMGVLSIGGIMGYSYAVDKYHANQIMNDVNLRGIDLIAQASRGADFSLAEWPTKTSGDLDIGLEVDEATNTTEGGIYVNGVEKRICEIIADDLLPKEIKLVIDGESYVSGACGETNKMVFYYDAVGEALSGETDDGCEGILNEGVCTPCPENTTWSDAQKACICNNANQYLNGTTCTDCPENAAVSADGRSCECQNSIWNYEKNTCEIYTCLGEFLWTAQNPEKVKFKTEGDKLIIDSDLTLNVDSDRDLSSDSCFLEVHGTLTINSTGYTISNLSEITVKSTTSHGIVLNNVFLQNAWSITAETTADGAYALYMNGAGLYGVAPLLEVVANGFNGGAMYMNGSRIDGVGGMMIRMKENAGNQVVTGQNSEISGITLMPGSLSIPETDGITLGDIYE